MEYVTLAACIAALGAIVGAARSRRNSDSVDPFHPLLFPALYVAVATLAPTVWLVGLDRPLGFIQPAQLALDTPRILSLAVVGFVIGASIPFARRTHEATPRDPATLRLAGHALFLLPLALAAYGYVTGQVLTRGEGQATRGPLDSLEAAGFILAPAAVLLVAAGRAHLPKAFSRTDLAGVVALIALSGLNGRRGAAVAVTLAVGFAYTGRARRLRPGRLLAGVLALMVFAYTVAVYRTSAAGGTTRLGFVEVLLRDLGSVPFTTGITARMETHLGGSSIVAGLVRQLPGPVANNLLGQPSGTGTFVFRHLYAVSDNMGYGYSIPAEGVLNFGVWGALLLPFAMGVVFAWFYAHRELAASRAVQLGYFVAVATLPFAWRSDVLGATKGVLYPMVLAWLVFVYARTVHRWLGHRRLRTQWSSRVRVAA